jgi:hypothetical protein
MNRRSAALRIFLRDFAVDRHYLTVMAQLSFAMYEAVQKGVSIDSLATFLDLPTEFVEERIESARLCMLFDPEWF